MKLANIIVIIIGLLLIIGAHSKVFIRNARKLGGWLMPFAAGSLAMGKMMNDKDKNWATKLWLISIGIFLIICSILATIFVQR